jgi:hypothetical protein
MSFSTLNSKLVKGASAPNSRLALDVFTPIPKLGQGRVRTHSYVGLGPRPRPTPRWAMGRPRLTPYLVRDASAPNSTLGYGAFVPNHSWVQHMS